VVDHTFFEVLYFILIFLSCSCCFSILLRFPCNGEVDRSCIVVSLLWCNALSLWFLLQQFLQRTRGCCLELKWFLVSNWYWARIFEIRGRSCFLSVFFLEVVEVPWPRGRRIGAHLMQIHDRSWYITETLWNCYYCTLYIFMEV
jgi:hypothetical protein